MTRYVPIIKTRTKIIEVPIGDVGEVGENRLQMDTRERQKKAGDQISVDAEVGEQAKRAAETVTAALAAEMTEINKKAAESVSVDAITQDQAKRAYESVSVVAETADSAKRAAALVELEVLSEQTEINRKSTDAVIVAAASRNKGKRADDTAAMAAVVGEQGRKADDTVHAIVVPTADEAKRAVEDISAQVNAIVLDQSKRAADRVTTDVASRNQSKRASDTITAAILSRDSGKRAIETINAEFNANIMEQAKRATDMTEAAIIARTDTGKKAADQKTVVVSLTGYITAVISNTGFTNPNNTIGNTAGNNATLTATATGLAGLSSQTTNGTLHARFRDTGLSDLTVTAVTINVETSSTQGGLPLGGGHNVQYEYSLNNGSTWTTFHTTSGTEGKGTRSATITGPVAGSWANINQLRVRATGSVTSGAGLGATRAAQWFRAWITIAANRTYS